MPAWTSITGLATGRQVAGCALRRPFLHRRQDDRDLLPSHLPCADAIIEERRFFPTAAAAQEAGFRPCLRCRPETAPDMGAWRGTSNTVSRGLALIELGALDEASVDALATRLGRGRAATAPPVSHALGASPIAVAQTRRILLAKQLMHETRLPMTQVAFAAGFGSIRRFNETFQALYGRPPSELRRLGGADIRRRTTARSVFCCATSRRTTGRPCWNSCARGPSPASSA